MACIPDFFKGNNLQFSGFCPNPTVLLYNLCMLHSCWALLHNFRTHILQPNILNLGFHQLKCTLGFRYKFKSIYFFLQQCAMACRVPKQYPLNQVGTSSTKLDQFGTKLAGSYNKPISLVPTQSLIMFAGQVGTLNSLTRSIWPNQSPSQQIFKTEIWRNIPLSLPLAIHDLLQPFDLFKQPLIISSKIFSKFQQINSL